MVNKDIPGFDSRKNDLMVSNRQYQEALEKQIEDIKIKANYWVKGIAVIGGAVLTGYGIYKLFLENDEFEETEEKTIINIPSEPTSIAPIRSAFQSPVIKMIKDSIAMFLISIAKQKLQEYIESLETENQEVVNDEQDISTN